MADMHAWAGRYRFHFDEAMRQYWEEKLGAELDAGARAAALDEVRAEAEGAELEITPDGTVASRSRGTEFYRTSLEIEGLTARFEKPNGARVVLRLSGDVLSADEPGKPAMRFTKQGA